MTTPVEKFLSDSISAARESANEGVDDGAHTRLRLRESLANQGSRRKRFTLIAAVIGSLFGSTAFAYWAGWRPPWSQKDAVVETHEQETANQVSMRLPEARRGSANATPDGVQTIVTMEKPPEIAAIPDAGLVAEVAPVPDPPPAPLETKSPPVEIKPTVRTVRPPRVIAKPLETTPTPASVEPTPVEPTPAPVESKPVPVESKPAPVESKPAPVETTPVERTPPTPRVTTTTPADTRKAQPSAEIAAYRHAHELHFRGGDPKAALAAWDDYLAKFPDGSLAPEARYDRALVLVKLARWNEARAALAPFASAKIGAYRQKEAAEILAAIRDR